MPEQSRAEALKAFQADTAGITATTDEKQLRIKSRDFHWYSPVLTAKLAECRAEVIVSPKTEEELVRVAGAAARHRLPITVRGGGTGNYGQSVPAQGGVLVDMSGLDRVLAVEPGFMRMQGGAKIMNALEAAQKTGQQLMMYPSTLRIATIGGYIAGGFVGIGSFRHGIIRESGAVRALKVVTIEETPRVLTLRGTETETVQHAWGTNGIILEVELALVPAEEWLDCIALFPTYQKVMEFGHAMFEAGIDVFLLSAVDRRFAPYYRTLKDYFGAEQDAMFAMVKKSEVDRFFAFAEKFGGKRSLAISRADSEAAGLTPVYETAFNHTTLMALKVDQGWTYTQLVMPNPFDPALVTKQIEHFGDEVLMHHEFTRLGGKPRVAVLPLIRYKSPERLDAVMHEFEQLGCILNNPHVGVLEDGGRFDADGSKVAFRKSVDPHGLMNPGKSRSTAPAAAA